MLKCQFHVHAAGDPEDNIKYSPRELIKEAARLNYQVLAITCHRKIVFNSALAKFARKQGILLLPSIEFEISKKHILGINIDDGIYEVHSFDQLREYRRSHPDCLIIAPHPFFPGKNTLKKDLINNIDLFDAIEISWAYTKSKNYNLEAIGLAHRWKIPLIATSDCHILKDLDQGYCLIKAQANPTSILKAIRANMITNLHSPASYLKICKFFLTIAIQNTFKRARK